MKIENIQEVVEITEHERGQPNKRVRLEFFATKKAADGFVTRWNKKHCPPVAYVPDSYVAARKIT